MAKLHVPQETQKQDQSPFLLHTIEKPQTTWNKQWNEDYGLYCIQFKSSVIICNGWRDTMISPYRVTFKITVSLQKRDPISPDMQCCLQQIHLPLKTLVTVYNSQESNCLAPCSHWTCIAILDWHCWIKFVPCVFLRVFNECELPRSKAFGSTKQTKEQTFNQRT